MKIKLLKHLFFFPLLYLSFTVFAQLDDDPTARMEAEMASIRDPATGKIPFERLVQAHEEVKNRLNQRVAIGGITWYERGPNNIGGRTRALMFDPNDASAKKVWAGGVGGGLWYNTDITNASTVWQKVNDFWANLAISCIAFDPSNTQNFYVGTGEGWFNVDAQRGAGIWRSIDGGINWTQLASTASNTDFKFVQKIIVNNSGVIFAATQGGVYKSTDGGTTWRMNLKPSTLIGIELPVNDFVADLEIGTDGVLYASFGNLFNQGSRIFKTFDEGATWVQITSDATQFRTEIALAPSTSGSTQVIYAITQSSARTTAWLRKSADAGVTWTDATPSLSLTGNQAWYDLILAVKPNDPDVVIGGGNVIGRTTNGLTWITRGYAGDGLHPDHHAIVFRPGFPNEVIIGNDGGVYYSPNYGNTASSVPTFNIRNNGFNVTQYYSVAMKNIVEDGYILAGAQDNGTHQITSSFNSIGNGREITGGDGILCFIDQDQPNLQITSFQNGIYNFYNAATNITTRLNISGSEFLGPSDYNSGQNILYTEKTATSINCVAGIGGARSTVSTITHTNLGGTTLIRCGLNENTIYVGGRSGGIIKITNAGDVGGPQVITTIATGFAGYVSCIEIGATENELLVTRSNYGIKSVYYTTDGGSTWISKDEVGYGLPDIPIRYALFNPLNRKQVLLATELGVFSTSDITLNNPGWEPTNAALANVSCWMLRYRASDRSIAVATHGRGIFTSNFCPFPTLSSATSNTVCSNQVFNYTATTASAGSFLFAWTRAAVSGISNSASSGNNAKINETLINTTTNPITVTYLFTISPNLCGNLIQEAVNVTVNPSITPKVASYSVCQNSTVPNGQGLIITVSNTTTISGILTGTSPIFTRSSGNDVVTYTPSNVNTFYQTFTFVAPISGNTSFEITAASLTGLYPTDTYLSLYQTSFNPNSPATNFLRGDDDSGALLYSSKLTENLIAGTTYIIVVSAFSANETGTFTLKSNNAIFSGGRSNWYTSATAGSILTTGDIFNPVGLAGSGIPSTATIGKYTFYVANENYPTCRTATTFVIGSIGGVVNSNAALCSSTNSGALSLSGNTGRILRWESSIDDFANVSTVANTTTTLSYLNLSQTTKYRAVIQNESCALNTSSVGTISITTVTASSNSPITVGGTINLKANTTASIFAWTGPNAFTSTAQNPVISSVTTAMAGVYTISVTSPVGTCTATSTIYVAVNTAQNSCIAPTGILLGSNSPVDIGKPINLTSSSTGGISQVWTGPNGFTSTDQNPVIASATAAMAGVYTITIKSSETCTTTAITNVSIALPPTSSRVLVNLANLTIPIQDGNSWATAYGNLQTALSLAPVNSEIWVAKGIYTPTSNSDRTVAFNIPSGARLFGGFIGTETVLNQRDFRTNPTILSGEIGSLSTVSDNSHHVVTFVRATNSTTLDGFTIMAGNANFIPNATDPLPDASNQPLTINDGGGIGLENRSFPLIMNCTIMSNSAVKGGGLFATNNSNPTLKNCSFMGNQATFGGGAYHLGSSPTYQNIVFSGNNGTGGAIYNNIADPTITNTTVVGNGGNNGTVFNSNSVPIIKNSVIYGNTKTFNDTQSIVTYSIVEGGYNGIGNLNLDPQFVSPTSSVNLPTVTGNNRVINTSPAINGGENGVISRTDLDIDGNLRRFNGSIVDMGAYEFQGNRIGETVISIVSGNWENNSTWQTGRIPLAGDNVIINDNHIVTILNFGSARDVKVKPKAKLINTIGSKFQTGI